MSSNSSTTSDSEDGIRFKTESTRNKKYTKRKRSRTPERKYTSSAVNQSIGPALPPRLQQPSKDPSADELSSDSSSSSSIMSDFSDSNDDAYGPMLPPKVTKIEDDTNTPSSSSSTSGTNPSNKIIGPTLPPHIKSVIQSSAAASTSEFVPHFDASPPKIDSVNELDDDDDDDVTDTIGPLPGGMKPTSKAHYELEKRAIELKMAKLEGGDINQKDVNAREEWMLELPKIHSIANMGLVARQFQTKERPDFSDRTSWTDTPKEKDEKVKNLNQMSEKELEQEKRALLIAKRNAEQEELVKKHKKKHKRDESLIDLHQKKLNKKKKKEERERKKNNEKPERRRFDRELDLKVNRFDEAQKKAVLKKAQLLDTRFSSGHSKFL